MHLNIIPIILLLIERKGIIDNALAACDGIIEFKKNKDNKFETFSNMSERYKNF